MTKPMIENSDRGITVNKSLAWTIVVGLIGGAFYMGTEMSQTKTLIGEIKEAGDNSRLEMKRVTSEIDARLRLVENTRAVDGAEIQNLRRDFVDMRSELRGMRSDIQQLTQVLRQGEIK